MPTHEEEPVPPPPPAHHPAHRHRLRESLRLPAWFYLELSGALLLILSFAFLADRMMSVPPMLPLVAAGIALFLLGARLVTQTLQLRRRQGQARLSARILYWSAVFLPALAVLAGFQRARSSYGPEARREEAREALRAVFQREREFFREYQRYSFNVRELPLPGASGPRRYQLGFPLACTVKSGVESEKHRWDQELLPQTEARFREILLFLRELRSPEDCPDPRHGFEAYALGALGTEGPLDVWRIDETGALKNLR